ncbi:MAG: hypothetical protein K8T10_01655 [Candidatus Eremiobacteraeota bacterium]|nr:hypothetical protein [Candidatus Eremiobacteraeota bacterium]
MFDMSRRMNLINLIKILPEKQIEMAEIYIKSIISQLNDPVLVKLLTADNDDEPLTAEEIAEGEANWQAYLRGEAIDFDNFAKELSDGE